MLRSRSRNEPHGDAAPAMNLALYEEKASKYSPVDDNLNRALKG
jgi:hypothetical protein